MLNESDRQRLSLQPRNEDIDREFLKLFGELCNQGHQLSRLAQKAKDQGVNLQFFFELVDWYLGEAEALLLKFVGDQSLPSKVRDLLQKSFSSEGERFIWDFLDDNDADGSDALTEYENRVLRCDDIECQECIERVKLEIAAEDAAKAVVKRGARTKEELIDKLMDEFKKRLNPPTE